MSRIRVEPQYTRCVNAENPKYTKYAGNTERLNSTDTRPYRLQMKKRDLVATGLVNLYTGAEPFRDPRCTLGTPNRSDKQRSDEPMLHGTNQSESVAAQSCLEMGFPREKVETAIRIFAQRNGTSNFKGKDLCEILFEMEENEGNTSACDDATDCPRLEASSEGMPSAGSSESVIQRNETLKQNQGCRMCMASLDYFTFIAYHHLVTCDNCYSVLSGRRF